MRVHAFKLRNMQIVILWLTHALSFLPHCSLIAAALVALASTTALHYSRLCLSSFVAIFFPLDHLMSQHPLINLKPTIMHLFLAQVTWFKQNLLKPN